MPFYTLLCRACGCHFEQLASIKEKEEGAVACPDCGSHDCVTDYQAGSASVHLSHEGGCPHAGSCGCGCHGGR